MALGVIAVQMSTTGLVPNTAGLGKALSQQLPVPIYIETNDTLANVTASGYLNKSKNDFQFPYSNQQMALVYTTDGTGQTQWLNVAVTGTAPNYVYSLVGTTDIATVFIASVGSAAAPSYTFSGDLDTGMYHSAANTIGFSANGALVAAIATTGLAVTGLISATTTISAGTNLSAGSSGVAGTVTSFPTTAANGSLILSALNAGGAFNTTIRNSIMGQSTVYSLGDIGAATGGVVVATTAVLMKKVANAAVAGGAAAQVVTDAFCTSSACTVVANWRDTTTPASILTVLAGNGSFTVTSSADPGASHIDYIITK